MMSLPERIGAAMWRTELFSTFWLVRVERAP